MINWNIFSANLLYQLSYCNDLDLQETFISSLQNTYRKYCDATKLPFADNEQDTSKIQSLRKTYFLVVFSRLDSDFVTVRAPKTCKKIAKLNEFFMHIAI